MTHVKFNRPLNRYFTNIVDELFNDLPVYINEGFPDAGKVHAVPVNILEQENGYSLEMSAPGFEKENFKISLDDTILTISAERKAEGKKENEKQVRKEFSIRNFKRSFTIDEKIDATGIEASYINGVLKLNLPKIMEVRKTATEINIR